MNPSKVAKSWKVLESILNRIPDTTLKLAFKKELERRAVNEWGYCPTETQTYKEEGEPELEDWQKEIYKRIQVFNTYGVDIRTEEEKRKLHNETLNNMCEFINRGGIYWEIPEDIRCDSLKKNYDEAEKIVFSTCF